MLLFFWRFFVLAIDTRTGSTINFVKTIPWYSGKETLYYELKLSYVS